MSKFEFSFVSLEKCSHHEGVRAGQWRAPWFGLVGIQLAHTEYHCYKEVVMALCHKAKLALHYALSCRPHKPIGLLIALHP